MGKRSVVFELTDREFRAFWFTEYNFRKQGQSSSTVKFDRIPILTGVIEQGNVRNEDLLIDILSTYGAQHSKECQRAYLALPHQQGFIRSYALPWIPKRDRKSAISLLVDEEISIARSDLLYDFLVLSEEKYKVIRILLAATRQSLLERYVNILERAGFKVSGVDFAFSILGQSLGLELNENVLYLQGESDTLQMVLFRGNVPDSIRSWHLLQRPRSLSVTEENGECEDEGEEEWENEIRRFLLYYRTQHSNLSLQRLVWSGDSKAEFLAQRLVRSNHVSRAERAQLRNVPESWEKVFAENKGWGEVAIGYGIRILTHCPQLNLWRRQNLELSLQRKYQGLALFLSSLFLLGTFIWFFLAPRVLSLHQEVKQLSRQGARIQAQNKHQEELKTAWLNVTSHAETIGDDLAQIRALQGLPGMELTIEQVIYKQGSLSLRGNAQDAFSVQTLIRTLQAFGWEKIALLSYKLTPLHTVEFSLGAQHGGAAPEQVNPVFKTPTSISGGGSFVNFRWGRVPI